jgi:hypothetical protein
MMIAVFRPYDLGDRVFLAPLGSIETGRGNGGKSWLVEEINLGATKMRYGPTGETGTFRFLEPPPVVKTEVSFRLSLLSHIFLFFLSSAYIQNYALADMRIYNLNRTENAAIKIPLNFHISIFDGDNLKQFQEALENYVKDFPRRWKSLDMVRVSDDIVDELCLSTAEAQLTFPISIY